MIHPFLGDRVKASQYVLMWTVYAFVQAFAMHGLVALPFAILLIDAAIHAVIFMIISVFLWNVVNYGNFMALTVYQRIVNNIALALLSIAGWLGAGYGITYWLYGNATLTLLTPFLPLRALIGLLIYLLIMQRFSSAMIEPEMNDSTDSLVIKEEIKQKKDIQDEIIERIAVKSGTKIHVVMVPEILYLQADGDYVQIFTAQGKYLKEQTMKYFEEHLPVNQFVRVHRSVIVNVEMISRIELYEKQNQLLTLKNGQQIKTSPGGYKALRLVLNL